MELAPNPHYSEGS